MEGREEKKSERQIKGKKNKMRETKKISSLLSLADQGGSCNSGPLLPYAVTAVAWGESTGHDSGLKTGEAYR